MTAHQPASAPPPAAPARGESAPQFDCNPIPTLSAAALIALAALVCVPFAAGLALGMWIVNAPEAVHAAR